MQQTMRAGVYNRVSDDRKGRSKSTREQDAENLAACREQGWTVAAAYTEPEGASASRFARKAREEWERFCRDLDADAFEVAVVWEFSRGSRQMAPSVALLDACRDKGVLLHVTKDDATYDPRKARDRKSLLGDAVDAEYESEKTSARIGRNTRARAADGKRQGFAPYGLKWMYDPETREFTEGVPHPEQAPVVAEIVSRIAKGEPIATVTGSLNDRGVPAPRGARWSRSRVRYIALNPAYIGKRCRVKRSSIAFEVLADAEWPAIVPEADHYAAARLLTDPSRRTLGPQHRPGRTRWLLSFLAVCGVCGEPLQVVHYAGQKRSPAYVCGAREVGKPSRCVATRRDWLDTYVTTRVLERLSDSQFRGRLASGGGAAADRLHAEAEALRVKLEECRRLAEDPDEDAVLLSRRARVLTAKLEDAERRAVRAAVPAVLHAFLEPGADIGGTWEGLSAPQRREVLRALCERIALMPQGRPGPPRGHSFDPDRVQVTWRAAP